MAETQNIAFVNANFYYKEIHQIRIVLDEQFCMRQSPMQAYQLLQVYYAKTKAYIPEPEIIDKMFTNISNELKQAELVSNNAPSHYRNILYGKAWNKLVEVYQELMSQSAQARLLLPYKTHQKKSIIEFDDDDEIQGS